MQNAKPGAGLPFWERNFIRYVGVTFSRIFLGWDSSLKLLEQERLKIQNLIKNIPKDKLQERVLIKRVFGIEEHSRDYSINMTLEHLAIVTKSMIFVIDALTKEQIIQKDVKIEEVKPSKNRENEDLEFFKSVDTYTKFIKAHSKKVSKATKAHPWFVKFNNKDWATFAYIHTFVHRRQIEAIIKKLNI